jgi:flagellar motor component MotA
VDAFVIGVVGSVIGGLLVLTVVGTACRCVLVRPIVNAIEKRYANATPVDD